LRLWNVNTGRQLLALKTPDHVSSLAFSPDGKTLAVAGNWNRGAFELWDAVTGQKLDGFQGHTDIITTMSFSPDGQMLATAENLGTIKLWDLRPASEDRTKQAR
jgi:WD40 repeat protein